jgi:hypothetical protein
MPSTLTLLDSEQERQDQKAVLHGATIIRAMGSLHELTTSALEQAARVDLAAAFRLAVRLDLHEGVCNHFSFMLPDGKRFLLNAHGLHWSEVTASNLLALDAHGGVLSGEGEYEKTAFHSHSRIHLANPHAACVLHTPEHAEYLERLAAVLPDRVDRVALYSGGAEAVEVAVRLAQSISGKRDLLSFSSGFHGKTTGVRFSGGRFPDERAALGVDWVHSLPYPRCEAHDAVTSATSTEA